MQPLTGITVISVEQAVAGPYASRQLADLGARVIKIERPGKGDFARSYDDAVKGMSSHFVWLNRSKLSLTLDLKSKTGVEIFFKLLEGADILLSNLAPGAMDRLGFSSVLVRKMFPRIITCEISGYGKTGPDKDRKAYDLLIQAETGVLSVTGSKSSPAKVGVSVADIAAGMHAFSGILTALIRRNSTGEGSAVEVSLLDALGEWMGFPIYYTLYGDNKLERSGTHHATIAPYGDFKVGDGDKIYLAVQNDREWKAFCEIVLEDATLTKDARFDTTVTRIENREALIAFIEKTFQALTLNDVVSRLAEAEIAFASVNDVQGFIRHPQLLERKRWREVGSPVGKISSLIPPTDINDAEPVMEPVPSVSEHTENILLGLGYESTDIEKFRKEGVI